MGQATKGSPDAAQVLLDRLGHLSVGEGIVYDRMVLFPLFPAANDHQEVLDYRTLEQAIADGSVKVTERASASVPELTLQNAGGTMVLIFDGEEIIGGQQNRVVNTTFLVAAETTMDLPVSCVERGRWHRTSATFASGESGYYALRMAKHQQVTENLRLAGRPLADQGEIWEEVALKEESTGSHSLTGAMHEMYETRAADLGTYQEHFAYVPGALGLLVALNGHLAGGDVFDQPGTAEALWQKLVRSYALDAFEGEPGEAVTREQALEVLEHARSARCEIYPSLALGEDVRFEGEGVVGGGLVYQERPVHVNLFCQDGRQAVAEARRKRAAQRHPAQNAPEQNAPVQHVRARYVQAQRVEELGE
jgi:hypothetical protein